MRLPPTKRVTLATHGVTLRIWPATHAKLRTLAGIRGQSLAETVDTLAHDALQLEYDRIAQTDE